MNKERIFEVADAIDCYRAQFDMYHWVNHRGFPESPNCGTPSCIAGFAAAIATGHPLDSTYPPKDERNIPDRAAEWLELSEKEADELFRPADVEYDKIDACTAIACLENLVETGCVDWQAVGVGVDDPEDEYYAEVYPSDDDLLYR